MHRFDFAITLCVIAILATFLLYSLNKVQTKVAKVIHETELTNLRLSLMEAWVHHTVTNRTTDIASLIDSNPMLLINERPENYIGEHASTPDNNGNAIWYFNTHKKNLVYVYNDGKQVHYKLASTAGLPSTSLYTAGGIDLVLIENKN